jgi:TatD DNase family protein
VIVKHKLIDTHCHLDFDAFEQDREHLITNATDKGIAAIVIPGTQASHWQRQIALCRSYDNLYYSLGIHPYFLKSYQHNQIDLLKETIEHHSPIAIGECGIDGTIENIELQKSIFIEHIKLSNQYKLPLIIHQRKSHHHILSCFKTIKPIFGGVIHAFSGSETDAKKYIEFGFKLGIGGVITYPRGSKTIETIHTVGIQHIVLETDAPEMPLHATYYDKPYRNEPANVSVIAHILSKALNVSLEEIAHVTTQNAKRLFSIPEK